MQQQHQQSQQRQPATEAPPQPSLEDLLRQMTIQNMQFQQETRASIQSLTNQMGQLATQLNQQQSQNSDKLLNCYFLSLFHFISVRHILFQLNYSTMMILEARWK